MNHTRVSTCLSSTGLDSTTAFEILLALRVWATGTGGTVVATLLQPIPEVYNLFDQIMLMQDGYNVYCGPREGRPVLNACTDRWFCMLIGIGVVCECSRCAAVP